MECHCRALIAVSMDNGLPGEIGENAQNHVVVDRCIGSGTVSLSVMVSLKWIIAWVIHIRIIHVIHINVAMRVIATVTAAVVHLIPLHHHHHLPHHRRVHPNRGDYIVHPAHLHLAQILMITTMTQQIGRGGHADSL